MTDLRPIPNRPGYFAGDDGLIYSTWTNRGNPRHTWLPNGEPTVLKASPDKDGYLHVSIAGGRRGAHRNQRVASLVLEAWKGPRPGGMVSSHLDGDILNNLPGNLAWETQHDNIQRKRGHGTMHTGTDHHNSISPEHVKKVKEMLAQGITQTRIAEEVGVSTSTVSNIKRGERHARRPAALFDMDGTLCDVSSIRFHVNSADPRFSGRKRFDLFHAASVDCPPNAQALRLYEESVSQGRAIIIVTARKEQWRYHTIIWLRENNVEHDEIFMRADNDNRKDFEVKEAILSEILERGYQPVLAVDDNPAIIDVWERNNIPTVRIPGWEN